MRQFGLALGGCENSIEELIKSHLKTTQVDIYTLIEIGSAGCVTLRAMKDIIVENRPHDWRVFGFDLPQGWSLDWNQIRTAFDGQPRILYDADILKDTPISTMNLWLLDDPRKYLKNDFPHKIDFAFIDGCHGKCSRDDFEAIEPKVRTGGLVMFHDVGVLEQGRDFQPHCNEYINVRKHITDLGLLNNTRPGWNFVGEIPGSRVWGGDGNSCAVFQKL